MKKPKKFNWDNLIPLAVSILAIFCEVVLIVFSIKTGEVKVEQYILQCVGCIMWIIASFFLWLTSIQKEK